jgi:hypothetical protein
VSTATAASAPPDEDCKGYVLFKSIGSWDVSGGPASAQTPGQVTWRCGDYRVTARSREDRTVTKSAMVHVRRGDTWQVDLR